MLGAVAAAAAAGGGLIGALLLQSEGGAAELLSTEFTDLQGKRQRLADRRARVLLCNFWATWCAPCREEIPLLVAATQQYAGEGVQVIGIGIDHADKLREFATIFAVNYPIFIGTGEAIGLMHKLGNKTGGLPYNVVLDRHGAIQHRKLGSFSSAELRQVIDGLLQ